jgi:hypothetical protein
MFSRSSRAGTTSFIVVDVAREHPSPPTGTRQQLGVKLPALYVFMSVSLAMWMTHFGGEAPGGVPTAVAKRVCG